MPDAIIFEGSEAKSPVEEMLQQARHAALKDNLAKLKKLPEIDRIIIATNRQELASLADSRVIVEVNSIRPGAFHFGRHLLEIVERYRPEAVICLGGAAVPLIQPEELAYACRQILERKDVFVTNNVQSADLIAFNPAAVLFRYEPPATDNALALLLRYDACFEQVLLPLTLGTQFDIDTPADLLVMAASPFGGPHLRRFLDTLNLDTQNIEKIKEVLCGDYRELALIGRIGAPVIARLNRNFKVRLRVFSEERGMKALGRLERNEVGSLLGYWLEEAGPEKFFNCLAKTVAAAIIDSRVLFAHRKREISDADRFYSDLGEYGKIQDPFVREFTRAAVHSGIPVLLGGHSLVAGGIFALIAECAC